MPIRQGASTLHHALKTVGVQYMFAELNWRETEIKCSGKGRGGLSSSQHSVDGQYRGPYTVPHCVEGPRDTQCRQAEGNKRERECLFQFSQHKPFSRAIGFPGGASGKESANAGDAKGVGLIPGLGRYPGEGKGKPLQDFLPGKFHGQRSLEGKSPWDCKELDTTEHAYAMLCCRANLPHPGVCETWSSHPSFHSDCQHVRLS